MLLTPTELERLTIYTAADLARKHRAKGLKLNYPEAIALICNDRRCAGKSASSSRSWPDSRRSRRPSPS